MYTGDTGLLPADPTMDPPLHLLVFGTVTTVGHYIEMQLQEGM
jgi:hypothetical protein